MAARGAGSRAPAAAARAPAHAATSQRSVVGPQSRVPSVGKAKDAEAQLGKPVTATGPQLPWVPHTRGLGGGKRSLSPAPNPYPGPAAALWGLPPRAAAGPEAAGSPGTGRLSPRSGSPGSGPRIAAAVQMPGKQPDALPELPAATPQRRGGEDQASSCAYTVGILRPGPIGDKEEGNPPRKKLQNAPECLHIKLT